jgi:hypothetical protein
MRRKLHVKEPWERQLKTSLTVKFCGWVGNGYRAKGATSPTPTERSWLSVQETGNSKLNSLGFTKTCMLRPGREVSGWPNGSCRDGEAGNPSLLAAGAIRKRLK